MRCETRGGSKYAGNRLERGAAGGDGRIWGGGAESAGVFSARKPEESAWLDGRGEISGLTMGSGEDWRSGYRAVGGTEPAKFQIGNLRASGFSSTGQAFYG